MATEQARLMNAIEAKLMKKRSTAAYIACDQVAMAGARGPPPSHRSRGFWTIPK